MAGYAWLGGVFRRSKVQPGLLLSCCKPFFIDKNVVGFIRRVDVAGSLGYGSQVLAVGYGGQAMFPHGFGRFLFNTD
ncbi:MULTISPECIES: hypothetical protein [Nitrosomonas]|uniref:hypothetical protein n=1 Tax=Nitrosomonas TaxID=914 RepID=UPI001395D4A5|nr:MULTISPECIES: hypothetical protein [Nitrosomonas]UVS63507.1 hypothetical protein NX761_02480 [Nitrosomonas sp. PLL12]